MSVFLQPGAKQRIYWYRFMYNGLVIRRSTKQSNHKVALQLEAEHRSKLAKGEAGIYEKTPAPTLAEFSKEFLVWAEAKFRAKPKSYAYYWNSVHRLLEYPKLTSLTLDDARIPERLTGYIAKRQVDGLKVSSINHELRCVRRMLHLAVKWSRIDSATNVEMLPGETHREFVLSPAEEARYLAACQPLLASVATVLVDSGMRPEEANRLRWESVRWTQGRHGSLHVTFGKTSAARRMIPMTSRVRAVVKERRQEQGQPIEGWIWPGPTRSGHIEPCTLKKAHKRALRDSRVRTFVLYSLRHTFLTRLGMSGCDTWTFARLAGHGNVKMSERYVHPNDDNVLVAMEHSGLSAFSEPALGGPEFGHGAEIPLLANGKGEPQLLESKDDFGGQCRTRTCDLLLVRQAL